MDEAVASGVAVATVAAQRLPSNAFCAKAKPQNLRYRKNAYFNGNVDKYPTKILQYFVRSLGIASVYQDLIRKSFISID